MNYINWTKRRKLKGRIAEHIQDIIDDTEFISCHSEAQYDSDILDSSTLTQVTASRNESEILSQVTDDANSVEPSTHSEVHIESNVIDFDLHSSSDNSAGESDYELDDVAGKQIISDIAEWAKTFQIPMSALSSLQNVLIPYFPSMPKDPRTLLRTQTSYTVKHMAGGQYHYFGIEENIKNRFSSHPEFTSVTETPLKLQKSILTVSPFLEAVVRSSGPF